jgi:hypothetical protein
MGNDESALFIEALRRRVNELEHDIWVTEASIEAASGTAAATNRIAILQWKRDELRAINAAIYMMDKTRRPLPAWMLAAMISLTIVSLLVGGWALWMQLF